MSWIKDMGLIALSTLFCLALIEGGIRLAYPLYQESKKTTCRDSDAYDDPCEFYGYYDSVAKMRYYSKAGYRPLEGAEGHGYKTNTYGLRTDKDVTSLDQRIVVSGGSTAFGAGVKQEDTFIEKTPNAVSAGVGGYVFANEFAYMRDFVHPRVQPDRWVSFSGWNDVYAAYRGITYYKSPDMFDLEGMIYHANATRTHKPPLPEARMSTSGTSLTYHDFTWKLEWVIRRALVNAGIITLDYQTARITNFGPIEGDVNPADYDAFKSLFFAEITLANHWAKAQNISFIFILQPSLYSTDKELSPSEQRILNDNEKRYPGLQSYFDRLYTQLRNDLPKLAEKEGFTFIDSNRWIADSKESFFVDHVHFGSKGNDALAQGLTTLLTQE